MTQAYFKGKKQLNNTKKKTKLHCEKQLLIKKTKKYDI